MDSFYPFENTPLPYSFDALEPYIDAKTMELHHNRHLQTYIDNLNKALAPHPAMQNLSLEFMLSNLWRMPRELSISIRNNGGGVYNHQFFFEGMSPNSSRNYPIVDELAAAYGSFENFKSLFKEAALSVFGSGYAWLICSGSIFEITTSKNQNTPDLKVSLPLLNLDVWEHAYYLKHYNERNKYIDDWFNVINWEKVNLRKNGQIKQVAARF